MYFMNIIIIIVIKNDLAYKNVVNLSILFVNYYFISFLLNYFII
jgi:hypothetical protein